MSTKSWHLAVALLASICAAGTPAALAADRNADQVPYTCKADRERCIIPVYMTPASTAGGTTTKCKATVPFDPIYVPTSTVASGKPIRIVWLLVAMNSGDQTDYEYVDAVKGVMFTTTNNPPEDPSQDFNNQDFDGMDANPTKKDSRRFKWESVHKRTGTAFYYAVQTMGDGVACDPADPRIVNIP